MISEIFLVLAGHTSSLFVQDNTIDPAFIPLLHPGEQQTLEALGQVALRYRRIKSSCAILAQTPSRYVCAICATLRQILTEEYETLVVDTEAKVLRRDAELVASGSFVPLSTIRAIFSEWDTPLAALVSFVDELEAEKNWGPGPLIDMVVSRSRTGVHRVAHIFTRLALAAQRVWRTQLCAFIVHGSLSTADPLASETYALLEGSMPSCVSTQSRESIGYIGRAIGTVKSAKWQKQPPRSLAVEHTTMLESVLPEDQFKFDAIISQIRINISEWLWMNVLTRNDVEEAVDSLANYFLLRNGEFSLSLIREIEQLKLSRLRNRSSVIREQDLNLAILRASLGTLAQHDPALAHLRFALPSGPLRPLLPPLAAGASAISIPNTPALRSDDVPLFADLLLGTPLVLQYNVSWPLDLFLHESDLQAYGELNAFLASLRKTHTRIHTCWTSLSNAQRARRRWTGLGEGGTHEDLEARSGLLRCGWGVVRDMEWFLDTLLGYVMMDVIDVEFVSLKRTLSKEGLARGSAASRLSLHGLPTSSVFPSTKSLSSPISEPSHLDFTTLRTIHTSYLDRLRTGCLLNSTNLTSVLRSIFEACERFVAQVERWGGDVLPALLFEGSIHGGAEQVGGMVKERWIIVRDINDTLHSLLESFYEQLSLSISQQPFTATDASKSFLMNTSIANLTVNPNRLGGAPKGLLDAAAEVRRHVERLLLRLDFNGGFSMPQRKEMGRVNSILREGGLV